MNREELKALNDEQLREILLAEFESPGANVELIQTITDILRERHPENERDAHEAYREFEEGYAGTELLFEDEGRQRPRLQRKHKRWKRAVVAVAAVLIALLGTTVVASAAGIDIWGIIRDWTQETFGFETRVSDDAIERVEPNPIDAVNQLLIENGMPTLSSIAIPEGYECVSTYVAESRRGKLITAEFSDGMSSIVLSVQEYSGEGASMYFPKDEGEPKIITVAGVDYYVTTNEDWSHYVWIIENIVVEIGLTDDSLDLYEFVR